MKATSAATKFSKGLHKVGHYAGAAMRSLVPASVWHRRRASLVDEFYRRTPEQRATIEARVAYYNRLTLPFPIPLDAERVGDFTSRGKSSAYASDFRDHLAGYNKALRVSYQFGDVTEVPETPRFVKSRPIDIPDANRNAVLLKLNSVRHYRFFRDPLTFAEKRPQAVWRGKSNRPHRIEFAQRFAGHPLCDIGCTLHKEDQAQTYHRDFLCVEQQLGYRYIVSVEGIDVATNLKWIMGSNSLCLMRKPRFETWFMEGALIPGYHYVQLRDDHSDLIEKIEYFNQHPAEAEAIIANANRYVATFMDRDTERLVSSLVIDRYLHLSGQIAKDSIPSGAGGESLRRAGAAASG